MTMRVTVGVIGSSLVYFDGNFWHIVFVTDNCHEVSWASPSTGGQYRPFAKPTYPRTVTFRANGATPATGWDPAERDNFLNLSAPYLHGDDGAGRSNLTVVPNSRNGRQYVHLKIPFGTVVSTGIVSNDYYYQLVGNYYRVPLGKGVATSFSISFDVDANEDLYLDVDDGTGMAPIRIPYTPSRVWISYNNYCAVSKGYNDFIHHYDWVYDKASPSPHDPIQFIAGEVSDPLIHLKGASPKEMARLEASEAAKHRKRMEASFSAKALRFGPDGDCDPVIIEPPPGD